MKVNLELSVAELKVFTVLLDRTGEAMSCNSCNDFSLSRDGGLNEKEIIDLTLQMSAAFPNDDVDSRDCQSDFFVLALLGKKLQNLLDDTANKTYSKV